MQVYIVRHKHYGTSYVGKTKHDLEWRWKQHVRQAHCHANSLLGRAINKYGPDAFNKEVICTGNSEEELNEIEKICIAAFGTKKPNGYNMTDGGDGVIGLVFTPAIRQKLKEAARRNNSAQYLPRYGTFKGKTRSPESRRKIGLAGVGRECKPESREKLRQAHLGRKKSEIELANIRSAAVLRRGRPMSEEQKKKISEAKIGAPAWNKGRPHTEEHKQKLKEAWKTRPKHSEETKEKMRQSGQLAWIKRKRENSISNG